MKQTETYSLNLIEMSDTFSTAPLNENAQKLESAVTGEAAQRAQADAALSQRIAALENRKVVFATYRGDGGSQTIQLGFDPAFLAVAAHRSYPYLAVNGQGAPASLRFVSGGFTVNDNLNLSGTNYNYLAVL